VDPFNFLRESPAAFSSTRFPAVGCGIALAKVKALLSARSFPAEFVLTESREEMESRVHKAISAGNRVRSRWGRRHFALSDGTLRTAGKLCSACCRRGWQRFSRLTFGLPKDLIARRRKQIVSLKVTCSRAHWIDEHCLRWSRLGTRTRGALCAAFMPGCPDAFAIYCCGAKGAP